MDIGRLEASDTAFKASVNGNLVGFDCSFHKKHSASNDHHCDGCYLFID